MIWSGAPAQIVIETAAVALPVGNATFSGVGSLTVDAVHTPSGASAFFAEGFLSTGAAHAPVGAATFSGTALIAVSAALIAVDAATFVGVSALSSWGALIASVSATLAGEGFLAVVLEPPNAAAALTGAAALSADLTHRPSGAAALTGAATLSVDAIAFELLGAIFAGEGFLSLSAVDELFASAVLAADSQIIVTISPPPLPTGTIFQGEGLLDVQVTYAPMLRASPSYILYVPDLVYAIVAPPIAVVIVGVRMQYSLSPVLPDQYQTIAFDFGNELPTGVTLVGTPTTTITVASGDDPAPQSRLTRSPNVGTVSKADKGTGITNAAVLFQVGTCVANVVYILDVTCDRSDGDVAAWSTHLPCKPPGG